MREQPHLLLNSVTHCHLLPETLLPPVCWSLSSWLRLSWEETLWVLASAEEHQSLPPTPLDLERDVSTCCQLQTCSGWWAGELNAGELESKAPGDSTHQHHPPPAKECLTHMQCQGKALWFYPETAVYHNKHHLLPLLCSSFQIQQEENYLTPPKTKVLKSCSNRNMGCLG